MYNLALIFLVVVSMSHTQAADARTSAAKIVTQIQRADYEGDRPALKRLYDELAPFADDKAIGAKVRYWRGFAMWRRAFNGFNVSVSQTELEQDLDAALTEFKAAMAVDPAFADAKSAAASCLQNISYIYLTRKDAARSRELLIESIPLLQQAEATEPENPRVLWVLGPSRWYTPPERGGGQAIAIETYEKGLRAAHQHKSQSKDVLTPSWGEPELLMNLAWSNLNKTTPDLDAAQKYAEQALALVPYWQYVRDMLLPQIREAKKKKETNQGTVGSATHSGN
jgi:tetratricopeptide (TPR) repeat protein